MKVSVIVPVYNAGPYLHEALSSLADQSFGDMEIICINDGSTDDSLAICYEFASRDSRFVVIDQKNAGPAHARNVGIEKASGDYICFMDADDLMEEGAISKMYDIAITSEADIFVHTASVFECDSVPEWVKPLIVVPNKTINNFKISDIFDNVGCRPFLWMHFVKSSIIKDNNLIIDEKLKIGEDQAFEILYFSHARKVVFRNVCLYRYRCGNPNSIMKQYDNQLMEKMWQHIEMIQYVIYSLSDRLDCYGELKIIQWVLNTMYWDLTKLLFYDQSKYTPSIITFLKQLHVDNHLPDLNSIQTMMYEHIIWMDSYSNKPDQIVELLQKNKDESKSKLKSILNKPLMRAYRKFFI